MPSFTPPLPLRAPDADDTVAWANVTELYGSLDSVAWLPAREIWVPDETLTTWEKIWPPT